MKRKTNLFYNQGEDNKFITFSNYTESLTGNFLSTDTKLFPSRFLCIKIDGYNKCKDENEEIINDKDQITNLLMRYYENKLAYLRDYFTGKNKSVEENIYPLVYLLEFFNYLQRNEETGNLELNTNKMSENDKIYNIVYANDITEQDYNGTFSDMIFVINLNDWKNCNLNYIDDSEIQDHKYTDNIEISDKLYGWENYDTDALTILNNLSPIYDIQNTGQYKINSNLLNITRSKIEDKKNKILEFDIIIPLYDIVNINYKSNFTSISESENEFISLNTQDGKNNDLYTKNVPLGLWFADESIKLYTDSLGNSQTWSLTISSQFKPFPYSNHMHDETNKLENITNAYATFAEVLSKQNEVINEFNRINASLNALQEDLKTIKVNVNNIGTIHNIDMLHNEILNNEKMQEEKFNAFKKEILDIISNITWKSTI